ncbi:MAG: tyrosine-protein phosphatase [Armatimonadetes bacterium]|nr:tyrosine-protein phosphatase [Armatimonadota bacterium]
MVRVRIFVCAVPLQALCGCQQPTKPPAPVDTATPAPSPVAATDPAQLPPRAGLPNFHRVEAGIYRGAAPTAQGLKSLRAVGVKTIIDLRIEKARHQAKRDAEALGFRWVGLPMGKAAPTKQQVNTLLTTLRDESKQPVYVHCQYGADRTGCMIGLFRVTVQDWSFEKAWAEMRRYGFKTFLTEQKETVRKAAAK